MKKKITLAIIAIFISAVIVQNVIARNADGQGTDAIPTPLVGGVKYQYAAKFVCGQPNSATGSGALVPGLYLTAINIHNPQIANVSLTKKVVQALSEDLTPMPPSQRIKYTIMPDYAFEIDCKDIARIGQITMPFFKGFVVIETPKQLDVVGVYTAANMMMNNTDIEVVPISPKAILPSTGTTAADIPPE